MIMSLSVFSFLCGENKELLTHPSAVSLGQFGRIAGNQFVLLILPAVTVNTTDTQRGRKSAIN